MSKKISFSPIVRNNIIFILQNNGQLSKKAIRETYVGLEPGCNDAHDFGTQNNGWSKLEGSIHTGTQWLEKKSLITKAGRGIYEVSPSTPEVSEFTPYLNSQPAAPVKTPVVETPVVETPVVEEETPVEVQETPVEEETPVIEEETTSTDLGSVETKIPVSVSNPSVIEAHIDLSTNELVENVGGSKDYRKSLDDLDPGYILSNVEITTSNVEITTSTLNVETQETQPAFEETTSTLTQDEEVVETQDESVEETEVEIDTEEVVDLTSTPEDDLEDILSGLEDITEEDTEDDSEEVEDTLTYDLVELRRNAEFDPVSISLKGMVGNYEVYRDTELRNLVITQEGRTDYVICPIDVDTSAIEDTRYHKYVEMAIKEFDTGRTHKEGSDLIIRALLSCISKCQHTDDFGGFVESCDRAACPIKVIWAPGATYVEPTT